MERNQNGYPTPAPTTAPNGADCAWGDDATLNDKPLAYAYVPIQRWRMLYSPADGLVRGTIFEELDKPKEVYGNEW